MLASTSFKAVKYHEKINLWTWSSRRFLEEFPSKGWSRSSLDRLIKKSIMNYQ